MPKKSKIPPSSSTNKFIEFDKPQSAALAVVLNLSLNPRLIIMFWLSSEASWGVPGSSDFQKKKSWSIKKIKKLKKKHIIYGIKSFSSTFALICKVTKWELFLFWNVSVSPLSRNTGIPPWALQLQHSSQLLQHCITKVCLNFNETISMGRQ